MQISPLFMSVYHFVFAIVCTGDASTLCTLKQNIATTDRSRGRNAFLMAAYEHAETQLGNFQLHLWRIFIAPVWNTGSIRFVACR